MNTSRIGYCLSHPSEKDSEVFSSTESFYLFPSQISYGRVVNARGNDQELKCPNVLKARTLQ